MTLHSRLTDGGAVLRITIGRPPANIVDRALIKELRHVLGDLPSQSTGLRLIAIEGGGRHFSFGASVPEHLPDEVRGMLPAFHALLKMLLAVPVPTVALVRGRCLGGGLELAAACDVILAEADAQLGQPEVKLGVFAPAASALLPLRISPASAAELLLTGRVVSGIRAHQLGLVAELAEPATLEEHFQGWVTEHILPRSAVALSLAARASRASVAAAASAVLDEVEAMYLNELVPTRDGAEGIRAFMEKRDPVWHHA
ncbi:MAG: cyclohexa-1,5-dienecarbonyl-CoA hydratase [Proteobacteria bacterium]|nr:cyclohexa-1,5-dienecarbonyl-CoA hydratase [Pseudomonadota bacterium]